MSPLLQFLLLLVIIITAAKAAGALAKRFNQPSVLGELLVGLLLGPTAVNLMGWRGFEHEEMHLLIKNLAELGVILLMLLAGFETDLKEMRKVGAAALSGAIGGVVLPLLGGIGLALAFGIGFTESVFIGTILTATSVSISAQTLMELGRMKSKEGTTILGAAVIDDILVIILLSVVVALTGKSGGDTNIALLLGKMLLYFVLAIASAPLVPKFLGLVDRLKVSEPLLAGAIVLCLGYAFLAEWMGSVAAITGAYLAGVFMGRTVFKERILHKLEVVTYSFFVPIFLVSIGLEANARTLGGSVAFVVLVSILAVVAKIVGSGLGVRLVRFSWLESLRVGTGMVSRGEVALIVASIGLANGVIDKGIFSMMIIMTLFTTLVTPILLRIVFAMGRRDEAMEGR